MKRWWQLSSVTRPIFRYHGGKWKLAPWVISLMPDHSVYVEPFGGGGSILLRKDRLGAECYNDLDGEIVNVFRVLQDPGKSSLWFNPAAEKRRPQKCLALVEAVNG